MYSDGEDITIGVPQGSILGSRLFSTFLCELLLEDYFWYYADDTTPYFVGSKTIEVLESISCLTKKLISWFANNQMKVSGIMLHPTKN